MFCVLRFDTTKEGRTGDSPVSVVKWVHKKILLADGGMVRGSSIEFIYQAVFKALLDVGGFKAETSTAQFRRRVEWFLCRYHVFGFRQAIDSF